MIPIGTTHEMAWTVEAKHLASAFGSGLVDVLATPVLVGFCEECSRTMVDGCLDPGQKTVGMSIALDHVAATPPGMQVTVRAKLVEIDRRRLRFEIEAHDEIELVGRATHDRFIIDAARFEQGIAEKLRKLGNPA
jgi:fluoroacetyl-CoA thioesterase